MRVLNIAFGAALLALSLAACEPLGIPDPEKDFARKEAEGKAVGAACRHAGRAIEDCYTLNPKALKSAVFAGWKEMNNYMTENKLEVSIPKLTEEAMEQTLGRKSKKGGPHGDFPAPDPFIKPKAADEAGEKPAKAE